MSDSNVLNERIRLIAERAYQRELFDREFISEKLIKPFIEITGVNWNTARDILKIDEVNKELRNSDTKKIIIESIMKKETDLLLKRMNDISYLFINEQ